MDNNNDILPGNHFVKKDECPHCLHEIDSASNPNHKNPHPEPGDMSICFYCGEFLAFDDALNLRVVSEDEVAEFMAAIEPEQRENCEKVQMLIKMMAKGMAKERPGTGGTRL